MRTPTRIAILTAALTALAWPAGPLAARQSDAPLGGPPVKDRDVPGAGSPFGGATPGEPGARTPRIAPRVFFEAVRSLESDDAPPEVRLSNEQRGRISAIVREFRQEARAFREANRERISDLERRAGLPGDAERQPRRRTRDGSADAPAPADRPPSAEAPTPGQQAAREELRELMRQGPSPDGYYARIWEALGDEQRVYLRERLEAARRDRMMKDGEPIVREAVRKRLDEQDARLKELEGLAREQLREKLRDLPPEERERVLRLLRERRASNP